VLDLLNMSSIGDQLSLGALQTVSPANNTYGFVDYAVPIGRNVLSASASTSAFVIGSGEGNDEIGELDLSGDNKIFQLRLQRSFARGRQRNLSAGLTLSRKSSDLTSDIQEFEDLEQKQDLNGVAFDVGFDRLFEKKQMLIQGKFRLDLGNIESGALPGQKEDFWKLSYTWSSLVFVNSSPRSDASDRIIVRSAGQFTSRTLPPLEQFSLGGADLVRGYTTSSFSGDVGVMLGVDWFPHVPLFDRVIFGNTRVNDMFQFLLFADGAYGQRLGIQSDPDQWAAFSSVGAGIQVSWRDRLNGRLNIAFPTSGYISEGGFVEEVAHRIYADLTWKIH
jgi:hemolysin activation/secretion protein